MSYDSTVDTLVHINRVRDLLDSAARQLIYRGKVHDRSKLEEPELGVFNEYTPLLKSLTYGSPEYQASLDAIRPALNYHYEHNSHHPEHYVAGIDDMDLFDVIEMFLDWKAASERHADGDFLKSLKINKERFNISDQLFNIMMSTAIRCGYVK